MSYKNTSTNISLRGHVLTAQCSPCKGEKVHSEIDLNYYLSNVDGVITWAHRRERPGNFMATCINLNFKPRDADVIQCLAWKATAGCWVDATWNLGNYLANDNGVLKFNERRARNDRGAAPPVWEPFVGAPLG
ncbi:hypothetical protein HYH03_008884 [Edaphochlamys debaryana]|uniref:Cyanovirin-N domain-containing protein n=1 Tax=Edaphochlamys debaryana TaxID=47281 RepID=A0A835Y8I4_9CHLO|nr:hypothetical protein HYH03_008884 [Edaphochlamys debaryana]|eukprot:KAG2492979.1 hypothetical protein HYH03_008884 [Edaphochlamys debaryana]